MANLMPIMLLPFLIIFPPPTSSFNNETDLLSLLAFKSSLEDPHEALQSWNRTVHFCNWRGIRCGGRHPNRVVEINLTSQGLVGPLSPHVGNLSFLGTIILQNNTFHGQIPTQISLLTRLEWVEFSNNSLVGEIPRNLSQCSNLVYLNLIDNSLSGNIPVELGSMSKLKYLGLSKNELSGTIPPTIGNITSLAWLSLAYCGLKGEIPESLVRLRSLEYFLLSMNNLTGIIPSGLFNISTMQLFQVSYNKLEGVIPSNVGLTLPNLRRLYLLHNQLKGPIPFSISNASLLEGVDFQENYFTGPMPRVERLTRLKYFLFSSNFIVDDISFMSSLTNSTDLQLLEVEDNLLTGTMPESIANMSVHLRRLLLQNNKIHGNIPAGIENLIGLTTTDLSNNYLEGEIPQGITKLSNLHDIYGGRNGFTGKLPSSLGNLTFLSSIYLYENNFNGPIPSSLGNCTDLLQLDLSSNNFSGPLPKEIIKLSSISIIFNLSYNNLEGSIPHEVSSLTNLAILDWSNNRLSGMIPSSLSRCKSLEQIYLSENLLEGEIPAEFSALMGLQVLDLSRNNLSGPIPSFLGKLKLEYLNLSFNRLQGDVPIIGIFKNKTSISIDGNKQLCGGIPELKLPACAPIQSQKTKHVSNLIKILIPTLAGGGICLVLLAFFSCKRRMTQKSVTLDASPFMSIQVMRLSYADLLKATAGFSETNLLGIGRFGSVYKGTLDDGHTLVAVKVLNLFVRGATKSFMAECNALREVRHRNLLKILSVCESIDFRGNDFKALVYEYKANGSLEKWLHHSREQEGVENTQTTNLNLMQRLNIAIDIAQAIEYIHSGTNSTVIHGDLKPSNILLDHDMTACIGDFGLANVVSDIVPSHESSSSIGITGTIGYVPPEYGTSYSVSTQGDVYSFGIVLLELFTNKRPTDDSFKDYINLHNFVAAALPDRIMEIVDPQFQTSTEMQNGTMKVCVTSILSIGVSCSMEMAKDRLPIMDVVNRLCNIQKLLNG